MSINSNYVVVKKLPEKPKEGFETVDVQDNFVYTGVVSRRPDQPLYVDNRQIAVGDIVIFAKYSPDTHEMTEDGVKVKFVKAQDILEIK